MFNRPRIASRIKTLIAAEGTIFKYVADRPEKSFFIERDRNTDHAL